MEGELNTKIWNSYDYNSQQNDDDDDENIKLYISKDHFKIYPFYFENINVDDISSIKKMNNEMKKWK